MFEFIIFVLIIAFVFFLISGASALKESAPLQEEYKGDPRTREGLRELERYLGCYLGSNELLEEKDEGYSMLNLLMPCPKHLYETWLHKYIEQGNLPTHNYDYPFSQSHFKTTKERELDIIPLFGARSVYIVFPAGCKPSNIDSNSRGHNMLYWFDDDGNALQAGGFVPTYIDIS